MTLLFCTTFCPTLWTVRALRGFCCGLWSLRFCRLGAWPCRVCVPVFLVPWALVYREFLAAGIAITAATAVFLGVLVLGLAYEFKRGALEWDK